MNLDETDIEFCLAKAGEIDELYCQYVFDGAAPRRSVEDLLWLCRQYLEKTVNRRRIRGQPDSIRGYYVRYADHYDIVLYAGMNYCWNRFVLCKELFHVILDEDAKYRTLDIYEHVEEVFTKFPIDDSSPGCAATSEMMAEIAAMQFLFPYKARKRALIGNGGIDFLAIAEIYKVPQVLVEVYLSESYMKALKQFG